MDLQRHTSKGTKLPYPLCVPNNCFALLINIVCTLHYTHSKKAVKAHQGRTVDMLLSHIEVRLQ